jgi:hypothetical protein
MKEDNTQTHSRARTHARAHTHRKLVNPIEPTVSLSEGKRFLKMKVICTSWTYQQTVKNSEQCTVWIINKKYKIEGEWESDSVLAIKFILGTLGSRMPRTVVGMTTPDRSLSILLFCPLHRFVGHCTTNLTHLSIPPFIHSSILY